VSSSSRERPFVGRARELAEIAHGLDDALAGRGRLFLITGEPGIGKTRLTDEIATVVAARGVPVIWGRSWEAGGAPAYWPWLDPLATLAGMVDDAALGDALGDGAEQVGELLPALRRRLPPTTPAALSADEARFQLWRAVAGLVRRAATPAGLVLVFEDLHSADPSSLALLYFLAREVRSLRALLVATCRDVEARLDPAAGEVIARIGREGTTIALPRLARDAAADLVRQRVGAVDDAVTARIFESSQGNPLFLEEMTRLFGDAGLEAIAAGVVPSGVRDVISQRLDRVAGAARAVLDLAAVAGDELDLPLLAAASGQPGAALAALVAEATRVGVLAERGGRPRFSHALVREVLYRELPEEQRQDLHVRVGAAIECLHAGDSTLPLAELAHHALAGSAAQLGRAVGFAIAAARRSLEVLAHDEALALLVRARAAIAAAGNPPATRVPLLLALAETHIRRGEVAPGRAACCEAAALARALGDATSVADAALTYGSVFVFGVVDPVLVDMLEEALAAIPAGDSALRARLLARLGAALLPSVTVEEPLRVAREAIAVARRLGDPRALLETIHDALSALMDMVEPEERYRLNMEVEELATTLRDRARLLRTHARLAIDCYALGDLRQAQARVAQFEALGEELRTPWHGWRVAQLRTVQALIEGRFADAEADAARALALGRAVHDPQVDGALIMHREGILRTMERHDEMVALDLQARRERASFGIAWQSLGSAMVYARLEDLEKVRFHLARMPPEFLPPVENVFALYCAAEPIAAVGTPEMADRLYQVLAPLGGQYAMLGMTQLCWGGPITRLLGLLAARLGRWEVAIAHFEDAIARVQRLGARPHAARLDYELGRTLTARGAPGDLARGRALFTAALRAAEALGMPGLARLATERLAALPTEPIATPPATTTTPAPVEPAPLSMSREGEYWAVAFEGTTLRLKDSLGLQYLARLVAAPGRELHVLELAAGAGANAAETNVEIVDGGDAGELLDDEARAEYRRRLEDLRETVSEAESFGDAARASRARAEIDFLAAELGRAVGLGGRQRRAGGAAERARSAVQRRVKNALARLAEASPRLGQFLSVAVRTGNYCSYMPTAR
jgi:tetratricopeptide (TPR) repeat protein